MTQETTYHIDEEVIRRLGLRPTSKPIGAPYTRAYELSNLENVYLMESDLYGNPMPEGSCFLAFEGRHGLMGRNLRVEKLRNYKTVDLQKMIRSIQGG